MECDICLMEWDSKSRIPRLLNCGHTFCESCLIALFYKAKSKNTIFFCPTCKSEHNFQSEEELRNLIKNFNLLRIVEKIENKKSVVPSQLTSVSDNIEKNTQFNKPNKQECSNTINVNNLILNEQFSDQKCKKHNLPLYLYVSGTNMLLCDACVKETNLKAYPLPSELRKKIEYSANRICVLNSEIERLQEFFTSYQDEFMKVNINKLDYLFDYFHKIIQYNYNNSLHILNQCKKEQIDQVGFKLNELSQLQRELKEFENEILKTSREGDKDILKNNDKINKIVNKLNYFLNYELELNLLTMKIGIKEETKNNLLNIIQDSYFVDVEFASIKGEAPTIQHILQKDKFWICVCGECNNSINISKCVNCGLLRKLESFQNILINPKAVSTEEIDQLIMRRKEECKLFQEKLKSNFENEEKLYAIETEWFLNWKCFVTNDLSEKYLPNIKKKISINYNIGVLQPGAITNYLLYEKGVKDFNEKSLRKGLKKNEDYIIVNKDLWVFLIENYGGGPEISFLKNDDIYNSTTLVITEDLFYYTIHKKMNVIDSELTSREFINDSIVTTNFDHKIETKTDDTVLNEKEFIQHTYINYTNYNDGETIINATKLDETLNYGNNMENKKAFPVDKNLGIVFKMKPIQDKKKKDKEQEFSEKLKSILNLNK